MALIKIRDTSEKALKLNLDGAVYGSFAEIGAGQEVARWFFRVGAAAKTIAKTMSAYDMIVSDAIYGPEKDQRYVVESRLEKMLQHEFSLVEERLSEKRGATSTFFSFADTVAAKSYKGTSDCHGWMGVRFQATPNGPANDVILHVRMLDEENLEQQEALGIVGVNLMFACYYLRSDLRRFVESLTDGLKGKRVEIDVIRFRGPDVKDLDCRLASLYLVEMRHTDAVIFAPSGEVLTPRESLYRKDVLILRGTFRPTTKLNLDMLRSGEEAFLHQRKSDGVMSMMEIPLGSLGDGQRVDATDFLDRINVLGALGHSVLLSNFNEYYNMSLYLRRYTQNRIGFIMGVAHLAEIFTHDYHEQLDGGILEAFGKLFKKDVRIFVYPAKSLSLAPTAKDVQGQLYTAQSFKAPKGLEQFYAHLMSNHFIEDLSNYNAACLEIFSRDVLRQIQNGESGWESKVPETAVQMIQSQNLFGFRKSSSAS